MHQLPWKEVMGCSECGSSATAYVFGPFTMVKENHSHSHHVRFRYFYNGKSFYSESALIRYVNSKAAKR